MAIIGKVIFSLFIGVLIAIIIEKTANCLAAQKISVVFNNKLYRGTIPNGNLVEWNETDAWVGAALQHESETIIYLANNRYYYNALDDFYYLDDKIFNTDERIDMSHINEEND